MIEKILEKVFAPKLWDVICNSKVAELIIFAAFSGWMAWTFLTPMVQSVQRIESGINSLVVASEAGMKNIEKLHEQLIVCLRNK